MLKVRSQLIIINVCSKCMVKQLCMWVLFSRGWAGLTKLKQKEQNLMTCWIVWEKVLFLWSPPFFCRNTKGVISYLQVCLTRMLRSVSPAWQCWAMQVCASLRPSLSLEREHFHTLLQSWLHTIRFSPVCYFERQPFKTLVYKWRGTVECQASVAAEEGKQLLPGGSTHTLKVKEGDYWKTNVLSTVLLWNSVKFLRVWLVTSMIYKARDINFWLICMWFCNVWPVTQTQIHHPLA